MQLSLHGRDEKALDATISIRFNSRKLFRGGTLGVNTAWRVLRTIQAAVVGSQVTARRCGCKIRGVSFSGVFSVSSASNELELPAH